MQKIKTVANNRNWKISNQYHNFDIEILTLTINECEFEFSFNHVTKNLNVFFVDATRNFDTQKDALQWCKSQVFMIKGSY